MPFLILGVIVMGAVLIYRTVRPMMRSGQKYDAGAVSENWLQQQRGQSDDQTR